MKQDVFDLTGRMALVTGASRGIGKAIALALANRGCDVVLLSRDMERMERIAIQIQRMGRQAWAFSVDVSQVEEIERFFDEQKAILANLSIFVNNAAITIFKQIMATSVSDFHQLISTNVVSALRFGQLSASIMRNHNKAGSITFITSINALRPLSSQALYSGTKAMLESMMVCFANELSKDNIRVNSILPGAIYTDMNSHFTPEIINRLNKFIPLGRVGEPEDIGDVVAFVVSDAARYMTGSSIVIDGGMTIKR